MSARAAPEVAGDAGLSFDPRDVASIAAVLERALSDAPLHRELRTRALARGRLFSWERAAGQVAEVYREALAR